MIEYPKIGNTKGFKHSHCCAFVKYDGTNVGFEWSRKKGFHKARLRRGLFGPDDPYFGKAIPIFHDRYAKAIEAIFASHKMFHGKQRIAVFGEYYGPKSFAGVHDPNDEMDWKLFDIWIDSFGFVGPKDFISLTSEIPVGQCIYTGKFTGSLTDKVRKGDFAKQGVFEGVIIKAGKGGDDIEYAKVKTDAYMTRLRTVFGDRWMQFWE